MDAKKVELASMTDAEKLALALEALELAEGVMSYCQGDAWERECTAKDRDAFDEIYRAFNPPPPPAPYKLPTWPSRLEVRHHYGQVRCEKCNRKISGAPDAIKQHAKAMHPEARPGTIKAVRIGAPA